MKIDEHGIIVQSNLDDPSQADGGDSVSRNSLMAMAGDYTFLKTLPLFVTEKWDKVCRHPFQDKWKDPALMSRDQIICFAAGVYSYRKNITDGKLIIMEDIGFAAKSYADNWFINKDFLLPSIRYALYKAAGYSAPLHIKMSAHAWMVASLLWATKIRPTEEQNQTLALCSVYGPAWVKWLNKLHPDLDANMKSYWSGKPWRDQDPIYVALMKYIKDPT